MTPKAICIFILLAGLGLYIYSLQFQFYTNLQAKDNLDKEMTSKLGGDDYRNAKNHYYEEIDKLKTPKVLLMDLGIGLIIAFLTVLIFLYQKNIKSFPAFKNIVSIKKQTIYILGNLLWLILIPGTFWYYSYREARGDYPWFADSIGIPLMGTTIIILLGLIPLNLFLKLTSLKSNFPATIFVKQNNYKRKGLVWEMFWGFWLLINFICFISFVLDGDHISIPINLFFTYFLLTLRAGQINNNSRIGITQKINKF